MAWVTRTLTQTRTNTDDADFYAPSVNFLECVKTYTESGKAGSVVETISDDGMIKTSVLSFYEEAHFNEYKAEAIVQAEYTTRQTYCSTNNITEVVVQS